MQLYSQACAYAFRALTHLARHPDERCVAKQIAEEEDIPFAFLSKLLQTLVRQKVISAVKGPGGGFRLMRPASGITLYEVIQLVDRRTMRERCLLSFTGCSDAAPCAVRETWKTLRENIIAYLDRTTVEDVARFPASDGGARHMSAAQNLSLGT